MHSIWPWIAEHAAFLLTRFEVGHDGKTPYERLKGKTANVKVMMFAEGIWRKKRRVVGPLWQLGCMWEDGVCTGIKANMGEFIVEDKRGIWQGDRDSLRMVVGVPWRMNGVGHFGLTASFQHVCRYSKKRRTSTHRELH